MRPKKYNTPEEKREAMKLACRNWYHKHKNDPEYKRLKKYRYEKYSNGMKETKEEFMRSYNTDYIYYVRNVRTGKFQKKIVQAEENAAILLKNIKLMKRRLDKLLKKFGHLDSKEENTNVNQN